MEEFINDTLNFIYKYRILFMGLFLLILSRIIYLYYIYIKYLRIYSENKLTLFVNRPKEVNSSNLIIDAAKFISHDITSFTYSMYINIQDWYVNYGKYKHIFHRGTNILHDFDNKCQTNLNFKKIENQCPGIWLDDITNNVIITMTTTKKDHSQIEYVAIENVPINKYFCLTIVCDKNKLEVYINGNLVRTSLFIGSINYNFDNGYLGISNSFSGYISDFYYYPYSLLPDEIKFLTKLSSFHSS